MILFHEKDCIVQIPFGKRALCTKMATDETADKDRRAYKVPIPGNKSVVVTYGYPLLLGVTQMADGYNFAVEAEEDSEVYLLLYRKRGREPFYELLLDEKYRTGRIFSVFMKKLNVTATCMAVYCSSIEVPDDMTLEEAIEYAKKHINEIPIGEMEYISDSDEIDEENCDFDK